MKPIACWLWVFLMSFSLFYVRIKEYEKEAIMRKSAYIIIVLALTIMLFACDERRATSPITKPDMMIRWTSDFRPRFFYPSMTLSDIEKQVVNQMYEGLTRCDNGIVSKGMAKAINVSEDGLTYTFKLSNAQWSDGRMIQADDFLYSWERQDNYFNDMNLLYFDSYIDEVNIIDSSTIEIKLTHTNNQLLKELSTVEFMPLRRDVVDLDLPTPILISGVTNGPYKLKSYQYSTGIVLSRNVHYYDYYNVSIDEIHVMYRTDNVKVYQEFKDNTLDVVQNIDMTTYETLLESDFEFKILAKPGVYSLSINSDQRELRDLRLRQALNLAIDRSAIDPFYFMLSDSVAYSIFDEKTIEKLRKVSRSDFEYMGHTYSLNPNIPYVDTDKLNKVKREIDPSVFNALNDITIVTTKSANDRHIAELIKESWQEYLGINVTIVPKDRYDYAFIRDAKTYDIILDTHHYNTYNPRHMLKYFFSESALNHTLFSSHKFDNILMKAIHYDDSKLHKLYEAAIQEVDDSAHMIPIFNTFEPVLISDELLGWTRSYDGLFNFSRAYKEWKEEN